MKLRYLWPVLSFLISLSLFSCSDGDNDNKNEPKENLELRILGDWYQNPDGWQITFNKSTCVTTMWNGRTKTYNYKLEGNHLSIENYANISGTIIYIDDRIMRIQRNGMSDIEFKRQPNAGWGDSSSNDNDSSDNNGSSDDDNPSKDDNGSSENPPYENYIHYRYYQKDYYHELTLVKQEVELASPETIHGWNYKYLNCYIGDSRKKVGFQFESTYFEDEYPPTSQWPAMEYDITTTSGSVITHFPIARVFVYDDNMSLKKMYPTVGTGKIQYLGNKLIFDFTSKEKDPDFYVDLHFEGKLSY